MKRPLLLALLLSLLLHLALFGSGILPTFSTRQDSTLKTISMRLATMELGRTAATVRKPPPPAQRGIQVATLPRQVAAPGQQNHKAEASAPDNKQTASAPQQLAATPASAPLAEVPTVAAETAQRAGYLVGSRRHKRFPEQARLRYQVYYGDMMLMAGSASIDWSRDGGRYQLDSKITPILGPQLRYQSSGAISPAGLRPDRYTGWRNASLREHAEFDWENGRLNYGDNENNSVALQPGAQDVFSLIYQLALKGAAHPPVQITTGKKVYQYPLAPSGEADFDTGFGKIRALVFRAEGNGDRTEFWLAPDFANQPIRIIRTDSKMKLDMRATEITIDDTREWQLPRQPPRKYDK